MGMPDSIACPLTRWRSRSAGGTTIAPTHQPEAIKDSITQPEESVNV